MRTQGKTQQQVADALEISRSTVSHYDHRDKPPSMTRPSRTHRTRPCPFEDVWEEVPGLLMLNPGLQVKTIFEHLQRIYPGKFQNGQKRTLERRIKLWRMENGPDKEVIFEQIHHPGDLGASDFTKMGELNITILGQPFDHTL